MCLHIPLTTLARVPKRISLALTLASASSRAAYWYWYMDGKENSSAMHAGYSIDQPAYSPCILSRRGCCLDELPWPGSARCPVDMCHKGVRGCRSGGGGRDVEVACGRPGMRCDEDARAMRRLEGHKRAKTLRLPATDPRAHGAQRRTGRATRRSRPARTACEGAHDESAPRWPPSGQSDARCLSLLLQRRACLARVAPVCQLVPTAAAARLLG